MQEGISVAEAVGLLAGPAPLGAVHGVPAGGQDMPWSARVSFTGATYRVLTLVVASGGHIAAVKHFAITGVTRD